MIKEENILIKCYLLSPCGVPVRLGRLFAMAFDPRLQMDDRSFSVFAAAMEDGHRQSRYEADRREAWLRGEQEDDDEEDIYEQFDGYAEENYQYDIFDEEENFWDQYHYVAAVVSQMMEDGRWTWENLRQAVQEILGAEFNLDHVHHHYKVVSAAMQSGYARMRALMEDNSDFNRDNRTSFKWMCCFLTTPRAFLEELAAEGGGGGGGGGGGVDPLGTQTPPTVEDLVEDPVEHPEEDDPEE